jgi:serine protease AprX
MTTQSTGYALRRARAVAPDPIVPWVAGLDRPTQVGCAAAPFVHPSHTLDLMPLHRFCVTLLRQADADSIRASFSRIVSEGPALLVADGEPEIQSDLRRRGYLVRDLGPVPPSRGRVDPRRPQTRGGIGRRRVAARPPSEPGYATILISGPLLPQWAGELAGAGVRLTERLGEQTYVAAMDAESWTAVAELQFVVRVSAYDPRPPEPLVTSAAESTPKSFRGVVRRGAGRLRRTVQNLRAPDAGEGVAAHDVWLHTAEDADRFLRAAEAAGVPVAGHGGRRVRIGTVTSSKLDQVRRMPGVAWVEPHRERRLHNERALELICVPPVQAAPPGLDLSGQGQAVAIADTGIDVDHPDLRDRLRRVISRGRPGDPSDPHGHGTHVAGSVAGTGLASGGRVRGVAPGAELVFQSLSDDSGALAGLPISLEELFEEAFNAGARIHNCSWGAATESQYAVDALEVDAYMDRHPDFLVVISAGNEGTAAAPRHASAGAVDWLSLCSPGTSKNALVVGASRSDRDHGGFAERTYTEVWPAAYPAAGIGGDRISGDASRLAAFSSRGPCNDRRIKPDVVAPGTDVLSTRASGVPDDNFWGDHPDPQYAYMGGTSMAAPLVAGCAALIRQYYEERRGHLPSAALVKATLVNGTEWLTGADAVADHPGFPNVHQGFGRVCVARSLGMKDQAEVVFVDTWEWRAEDQPIGFTGAAGRWLVDVSGPGEVRACLAYMDPPGRGLQNDLNLIVQRVRADESPLAPPVPGNAGRPFALGELDSDNNVEVVRMDFPASGYLLLEVIGSNLLHGPQPFALVVSGPLEPGSLRSVPLPIW